MLLICQIFSPKLGDGKKCNDDRPPQTLCKFPLLNGLTCRCVIRLHTTDREASARRTTVNGEVKGELKTPPLSTCRLILLLGFAAPAHAARLDIRCRLALAARHTACSPACFTLGPPHNSDPNSIDDFETLRNNLRNNINEKERARVQGIVGGLMKQGNSTVLEPDRRSGGNPLKAYLDR